MIPIPEIEAYRFYKNTCHTRLVSFGEFKENLMKNGYIIISIENEGKLSKSSIEEVYATKTN